MSGSMTQEEWEASNFNNSEVERLRQRAEQAEKELERAKAELKFSRDEIDSIRRMQAALAAHPQPAPSETPPATGATNGISLKEADERNAAKWRDREQPRPNGVRCPKCGHELRDIPGLVLTSSPPKLNVICVNPMCCFNGTRVAP